EIIVSDNASTDGTEALVTSITDPRLRYVRNATNLGMVANFRRALSESRGKYVCFLGSDDRMDPEFIAWAVEALERDPDAAFAFAGIRFIGDRQGEEKVWPFLPRRMPGPQFIRESLQRAQNLTYLCGSLARTDLVKRLGLEDLIFFDWTLWLRLASHGMVLYHPQPLASYRSHAANETNLTMRRYSQHALMLSRSIQAYVEREQPPPDLRRAANQAIDQLFSRYSRFLGHDCRYSWGAFRSDLFGFFRVPGSVLTKLKSILMSLMIRLVECTLSWAGYLRRAINK
ncbi:MAG: glycosyltransferase family 2 protein, partial [Desulfobaccales bacterium]